METSFLRAETRSVLSKNRVEISLLRLGVHGSVIRLQGVLRRAAGLPELTHEAVEALEREIRRIPGVCRVEMHLSNWQRSETEWQAVEAPVHVSAAQEAEAEPIQIGS